MPTRAHGSNRSRRAGRGRTGQSHPPPNAESRRWRALGWSPQPRIRRAGSAPAARTLGCPGKEPRPRTRARNAVAPSPNRARSPAARTRRPLILLHDPPPGRVALLGDSPRSLSWAPQTVIAHAVVAGTTGRPEFVRWSESTFAASDSEVDEGSATMEQVTETSGRDVGLAGGTRFARSEIPPTAFPARVNGWRSPPPAVLCSVVPWPTRRSSNPSKKSQLLPRLATPRVPTRATATCSRAKPSPVTASRINARRYA